MIPDAHRDRVNELVETYGRELDAWANERVPVLLEDRPDPAAGNG